MEPYKYTYPEEEELQPRRKFNPGIFVALLIGLVIGGIGGYVLGRQSQGMESLPGLQDSPRIILIANAILVVAILILAIQKTQRRLQISSSQMHNEVRIKILSMVITALVMAGLIAFLVYSGKLQ
jgi:heme/copper-type cytochrome/quinol oxidase subunit 2